MNKKDLIEMIRQEVKNLAYETLRNSSKKEKEDFYKKPKSLTEEELEIILFHGGGKPEEKNISKILPITIKESYEGGIPKIQSSEVLEFEDSFEKMLSEVEGASVIFDKQSNGYSLKMWVDNSGIEAGASGIVSMGSNGSITWSYSLKNGLNIKVDNLKIDKGNRVVFDKIYNHYNSWQKDWREKLTINTANQDNQTI